MIGVALLQAARDQPDLGGFGMPILSLPFIGLGLPLTTAVLIGIVVEVAQARIPAPWGSKPAEKDPERDDG